MMSLNGLPSTWEPFIQEINARVELPQLDRLRGDCIQEESRLAMKGKFRNPHDNDHNVLTAKKEGGHWKKNNLKRNRDFGPSALDSRKKPKDLSHI